MAEFRILVPLDGSRLAEHSLAYLRPLRQIGGINVLLFSAVDEAEDFGDLTTKEAGEREFNVLSTYLREVAEDVQRHLEIQVYTKVARGAPAACILEESKTFWPDLVVISTHGRSGISRWRFGSVADKVIRGSEHNVLVIGPKAVERSVWLEADIVPAFKSILVPLDGSELAEEALATASRFAESYDSQIHFVRVVPVPIMTDGMAGEVPYAPDLLDSIVDAARTYLSEVAARFAPSGKVKTDVLVGPAASQLEEYAAANNNDLVIMTSHGRSGIIRTALGSVTDRLLGGAAPVLVVRTPAPAP
jgi:nucleotide-binding universal stress UspA family protein